MKTLFYGAALASLLVFGACDKKGGEAADDPAAEFKMERVTENIAEIKTALKAGEDAKFKCVAATTYAKGWDKTGSDKQKSMVVEIADLCTYQVPLLALTQAVEGAEAAKKAEPDAPMYSECFSAGYKGAARKLDKDHKDDAAYGALKARWVAVCPPKETK